MPKYFMGDTRLAGLERMMMDPSRRSESSHEKSRQKGRRQKSKSQPDKATACRQMNMEGCV